MQKLLKQKRQKKNPKMSASGFLEKYFADASPAGSKAANEWSQ
jgi:hypothetical protein